MDWMGQALGERTKLKGEGGGEGGSAGQSTPLELCMSRLYCRQRYIFTRIHFCEFEKRGSFTCIYIYCLTFFSITLCLVLRKVILALYIIFADILETRK